MYHDDDDEFNIDRLTEDFLEVMNITAIIMTCVPLSYQIYLLFQ
jgi:hypothetical protein